MEYHYNNWGTGRENIFNQVFNRVVWKVTLFFSLFCSLPSRTTYILTQISSLYVLFNIYSMSIQISFTKFKMPYLISEKVVQ